VPAPQREPALESSDRRPGLEPLQRLQTCCMRRRTAADTRSARRSMRAVNSSFAATTISAAATASARADRDEVRQRHVDLVADGRDDRTGRPLSPRRRFLVERPQVLDRAPPRPTMTTSTPSTRPISPSARAMSAAAVSPGPVPAR